MWLSVVSIGSWKGSDQKQSLTETADRGMSKITLTNQTMSYCEKLVIPDSIQICAKVRLARAHV